jgi:hypothetical protein
MQLEGFITSRCEVFIKIFYPIYKKPSRSAPETLIQAEWKRCASLIFDGLRNGRLQKAKTDGMNGLCPYSS